MVPQSVTHILSAMFRCSGLGNQRRGDSLYHRNFDVHHRVVPPRVPSIHRVKQLARVTPVPLEVFAFGSSCIMAEGRCYLSSYLTGESPIIGASLSRPLCPLAANAAGLESRLNDVLIDRYQMAKTRLPAV